MPSFGVSYLSKKALRDARKFMNADQKGVRDEIGFLTVHQRYADRFFPGTSVLHTRLRYALFVPWLYEDVRDMRQGGVKPADRIARAELRLTGRLIGESGVIGGLVYPKPIDQPPSYVYWTALQKWGLLGERAGGGSWSRAQVNRQLAITPKAILSDDDDQPLERHHWPFSACPQRAADWSEEDKLSFKLSRDEKRRLARLLRAVDSPAFPGEPSLLSRLVGKALGGADNAWDEAILEMAGVERSALLRAGQAAALSAVGRAIYAAQVETLKETLDKRRCSDVQRAALPEVVARWGRQAAALDWGAFEEDMQSFSSPVREALAATLNWIRGARTDALELEAPYRRAEEYRKQRRARLSRTHDGVERRLEWSNEDHGAAEPLHYRWSNIRRLLADLEGVG
jgi:hypothetical protein